MVVQLFHLKTHTVQNRLARKNALHKKKKKTCEENKVILLIFTVTVHFLCRLWPMAVGIIRFF